LIRAVKNEWSGFRLFARLLKKRLIGQSQASVARRGSISLEPYTNYEVIYIYIYIYKIRIIRNWNRFRVEVVSKQCFAFDL